MRYAAPPLGNLRFRAPQNPLKEKQTQDATSHGSVCLSVPQKYSVLQTTSEDCLFIDVQAPASANSSSKLPVMIWFQGGAYILNLNADYNATGLIQASSDNFIVVTFNYRVGLFGFLASQDVKNDGDLNAGLSDQRKAIIWVHNHISAFGGDPERVTLFGTSAGAGGVLLHTLAYGGENTSKPLFSAAISADPFVPEIFPYQRLEFQYQEILNATNCSSLECLRHLPTDSLLAANINRPFPRQTTSPLFYFSPCVDGIFFPDLPSKLLADGRFQRVPLLQGTVTDEGSIFAATANNTDVDQFDEFLSAQFPDLDTDGIDVQYSYIPLNTTSQAYYNRASFAYGDVSYTCYGLSFAAAFASANLPGIVPVVQAYWTSFARAHDPNVWRLEGSPEWKTWGSGQRLKIQTNSTAMEMVDRQQIENCEFWAARNSQVYH
uniref:Carboxylic ester hydrolase n=1 Tax=Talaromyces marneffei PM1 TaxID=1077442 RepID=A0A093XI19_TALMA